jgi:hypothetical protein
MDTNAGPPQCDHARTELRHKETPNGGYAGLQCLNCGCCRRRVPKTEVLRKTGRGVNSLPPWDLTLEERWRQRCAAHWEQDFQERRAREQAEFDRRYYEHLDSEKWRRLRQKVLARCKGICEGCGVNRAVQVHHLTYMRLGDEMLFDLAAVCMDCHDKIHGRPVGDSR